MLHLVFVEAALETVPPGIIGHPSVRRNAKRRKKVPGETLLNRSLHHSVMNRIPDGHKRGRPDIANICLLEALGSPSTGRGAYLLGSTPSGATPSRSPRRRGSPGTATDSTASWSSSSRTE